MSALWRAAELRAATGGLLRRPFAATGVSIDTRTLRPGDLFVALVGEHGDGHAHVATAIAQGAAGALVHSLPEGVADDAPLLQVADTLQGLRDLASFARARFQGRLVAVTGSVGKTTTKEMLRCMLTPQGHTWAAEASHNNQWGVPLTLARLSARAKFCIVEIGMNHAGEISPLARLARPHVAVITTIERSHIGYLGSIEAIADEKAAILDGLEPGGVAILPADSGMFSRIAARAVDPATFGASAGAQARLIDAVSDARGVNVVADFAGRRLAFRVGAPGGHMALNGLAALAAAAAMGADLDRAAASLADFHAVVGRGALRMIAVPGGEALLLDESYNASSAATIRAALGVLALQPAARRLAVLGDMLELGPAGPEEHAGLAADIDRNVDLLFACGPLMRLPYDAIAAARRGAHAADSVALAPIVAAAARPGDAILVKGSLGSRMRVVVSALEHAGAAA
jgi:UDP-N-acetylmuramoyl-tripeptide--D-alanyl-D-alanine ligase